MSYLSGAHKFMVKGRRVKSSELEEQIQDEIRKRVIARERELGDKKKRAQMEKSNIQALEELASRRRNRR